MTVSTDLKRFSIALPPALIRDLDRLCRRTRRHRAHVVREAIERWVEATALDHAARDVGEHFDALEGTLARCQEASRYALEHLRASRPFHVRARAREAQ